MPKPKTIEFNFRDGKKEVSVGDMVFITECNGRNELSLVRTIGRKYLYAGDNAFSFDGREFSEYSSNYSIYSSFAEYEKAALKVKLGNDIYKILSLNRNLVSLEDLQAIDKIIRKYENA